MTFDQLKSVLVSSAQEAGLKEFEVYYMEDTSLSASTLGKELDNVSSSTGGGISFRCVVNGKMGYASTEVMDEDSMKQLVRSAMENASYIESEDPAIIFKGSDSYPEYEREAFELPAVSELRDTALEISARVFDSEKTLPEGVEVDNASSAAAFAYQTKVSLFNSYGLDLSNSYGMTRVYAEAVLKKGEEKQGAYDLALVKNGQYPSRIIEKSVKRALEKIGPSLVPSGSYNIIFDANCFKNILGTYMGVFSAKQAALGLSKLAGKEGQKIAVDFLSIVDDPMYEDNPAKTPFDGEGVATYRKYVVEKGVLKTLLYDQATAQKAGKKSTGNGKRPGYNSPVSIGPYTVIVEPGNITLEEMMKKAGSGIFVNMMKGFHAGADPVSGDFSIESAGLLFEDGKFTKPVHSFTLAGNFFDLLNQIDAISDTLDFEPSGLSSMACPEVLVMNMPVAGK
ncbi:MAG: TldD/PmbA family protein [Clostridia bacterium]|nr:TldD/PmbA family protein [Clostridia bacterium]